MKKIFLIFILIVLLLSASCGASSTFVFICDADETVDSITVPFSNVASVALPTPEKEGHTFEGWYTDEMLTQKFELSDAVKGENKLYAKFTVNTYTFTVFDGESKSEILCEYGEDIPAPSNDYMIFGGYFTDPEFTCAFENNTMPSYDVTVYVRWTYSITVTVKSNIDKAMELSGGSAIQTITHNNPNYSPVTFGATIGYKFVRYEIGDVQFTENTFAPEVLTDDVEITAIYDYATYELPIVNIDTDGAPILNKTDYVDMTFSLENTDTELNDVTGGIRLRGNSTMHYDKKPYRIKFDKKQSLFGLEKAKSWVLLADYLDPSCLHNYTAFSLAEESENFVFVPSAYKINVYLNGEFMGLYTLCEQVQENEGRLDIEKEITPDMTDLEDFNFFICMDYNAMYDPEAILDETYFYIEQYDLYFELKYPEKGDFTSDGQFNTFFEQLKDYTKKLLDVFYNKEYNAMKEMTNLDSLIDYMIVDQIMGEQDHFYKSFNMFYTTTSQDEKVNNKLNFGPVWDYDWALYTTFTGVPNQCFRVYDELNFSNYFFKAIAGIDELYDQAKLRYREKFSSVLNEYIHSLEIYVMSISESLELNHQRWYADDSRLTPDITKKNIIFLIEFLEARQDFLAREWLM